jgi:hypothetical protein
LLCSGHPAAPGPGARRAHLMVQEARAAPAVHHPLAISGFAPRVARRALPLPGRNRVTRWSQVLWKSQSQAPEEDGELGCSGVNRLH